MLVVVAVLVFMIAQDITKSLKKVVSEIEVIAGGNFAHRMQDNMMKRKDDFGQLAGTLETMRESICGLLSQVKIEAANIDTVVESMDSSISDLNGEIEDVSATTEQLAASTEETAASTEQINSMTQQIDGTAKEIAIRAQNGATESEEIHKRAAQTKEATVENRQKVQTMLRGFLSSFAPLSTPSGRNCKYSVDLMDEVRPVRMYIAFKCGGGTGMA